MTFPVSRKTRLCRLALTCLLATGLALSLPAATAQTMDVHDDRGGSVKARFAQMRDLSARGTPVRIVGTCLSACTLFLGLPRACVVPTAQLGFHGPGTRLKGIPLPREEYERVSMQMAAQYPEPMRQWFLAEARKYTDRYVLISGRQAIAMGARECN